MVLSRLPIAVPLLLLFATSWAYPVTAETRPLCAAQVPQFEVDYRQTEIPPVNTTLDPSDTHNYLVWGEALQTTIAQQGYDSARRSLRSRPPMEQAGTLLGTVVRSEFVGDRVQVFSDIVRILRPIESNIQRDKILHLVALLSLEQNQLPLAIDAVQMISALDLQLETYSLMSSELRRSGGAAAQQVEDEAYAWLTTQPEYRAAVLSQLGRQYDQIQQPETARQKFEQAIAQLSHVPIGKRREAGLQFVSGELIATKNLALAMPLIQQLQDPEQQQLEAAIGLAQQEKYSDSVALATQVPLRTAIPELQRLIRHLLTANQLNCAMQVTFLPKVKEPILEQVFPELAKALIQAKREDEVWQILTDLERKNPWQINALMEALAPALVSADRPEVALIWALSLQEPEVRFDVLITLAKTFAAIENLPLATQSLIEAEQLAAVLLAAPIPSYEAAPAPRIDAPKVNLSKNVDQVNYEVDARRARQIRHNLRLIPIYRALGGTQKTIALLQSSLNLIFSSDNPDFLINSEYEQLTTELFEQYHSLISSQQAIAELNTRYQATLRLPPNEVKTRHLRSLAEQYARLGLPDQAMQALPFQNLTRSTQQKIILTLARQGRFEQTLPLARQLEERGYYDPNHPLETWIQLSAELAIAGRAAQAEMVFTQEIQPRLNGQPSYPDEEWIQTQLPQWSQYYAEKKLYSFVQRMILTRYQATLAYFPASKPDYRELNFPILPLNQILLQTAKIAVISGDTAQSFTLIQSIPVPLDRARCFALLAIDLDTMGYPDLAAQAIQTANIEVRSLPNHIGKAQALLEINQVQIQNGQADQIRDRLAQIAKILNLN
jgi:hypothetical protein